MRYLILLYFSASHSLIGTQQGSQRHDVTTDFWVVKYYGYIAGEKNQPAKFDNTDYQTLPIILYFTLFLFIYFVAAQKDCVQIL